MVLVQIVLVQDGGGWLHWLVMASGTQCAAGPDAGSRVRCSGCARPGLGDIGPLHGTGTMLAAVICCQRQAKQNSLPPVNWRWVEKGDGYVGRLQPPGQPLGVGLPSGLQCLVPYPYRRGQAVVWRCEIFRSKACSVLEMLVPCLLGGTSIRTGHVNSLHGRVRRCLHCLFHVPYIHGQHAGDAADLNCREWCHSDDRPIPWPRWWLGISAAERHGHGHGPVWLLVGFAGTAACMGVWVCGCVCGGGGHEGTVNGMVVTEASALRPPAAAASVCKRMSPCVDDQWRSLGGCSSGYTQPRPSCFI
jgi:hypothetical protein